MEIVLKLVNHWNQIALAAINRHLKSCGVNSANRDHFLARIMEQRPANGDTIHIPAIGVKLLLKCVRKSIWTISDASTGAEVYAGELFK